MSHELRGLCQDLMDRARQIPLGDTITLGWFSGEGNHNFILKGFKITEKSDYRVLEAAVKKNSTPVSCTCFSEILKDTDQVIDDLSVISTSFALCFFTDGYPVVSNYQREIKSIRDAIAKISGRINSGLFVGYGNYYNKELMSEMAQKMGASLTHNGNLGEFRVALESFIEDSRDNTGKVAVQLKADVTEKDLVFGINGRQITVYQPTPEGEVSFIPTKSDTNSVYVLTGALPTGDHHHIPINQGEISRPNNKNPIVKGLYAAAFVAVQRVKSDTALEILGYLGDKFLIDQVNNAFTNEEYGKAEASIRKAAVRPKGNRLVKGYDNEYLPKAGAFCLLDVMNILLADDEATFLPGHKDFRYKRIGGGTTTREGFPEFEPDRTARCNLNKLTWHKTKLNLSVQARIPGTIPLKEGYADQGFQEDYPTHVYRNYALVKDGFLNASKLPVTLSEKSFDRLTEEGLIDVVGRGGYDPDTVYTLHLDRVPVINRSIAEGNTSAKALCKKVEEELELQAKLKVLNTKLKDVDPDGGVLIDTSLTDDQRVFLLDNGIGKDGFSPPVDRVDSVDSYLAKEFKISAKGFSSLPKISEVEDRVKANKKLRPVDELMKSAIEVIQKEVPVMKSNSRFASFLKDLIDDYRKDLIEVRTDIQATKFAIILGKKWFDEFDSREDNSLELNGKTFTIGVKEVEVRI